MEKRDATLNRWCMKQSSVWWVTTNGLSAKSKKAWRKSKVAKCWNMRKLPEFLWRIRKELHGKKEKLLIDLAINDLIHRPQAIGKLGSLSFSGGHAE